MFGFPMPDIGEMVRQVEEWKAKLERLVCAVEQIQRDQAEIKAHLGIKTPLEIMHVDHQTEDNRSAQ